MVNIPEICSNYQKYGEHTRNKVNIPEIRSTYQKYGQNTKLKVNLPEILGKNTLYSIDNTEISETVLKYQISDFP